MADAIGMAAGLVTFGLLMLGYAVAGSYGRIWDAMREARDISATGRMRDAGRKAGVLNRIGED